MVALMDHKGIQFLETVLVQQQVNPFPGRQFALLMLFGDFVLTAALLLGIAWRSYFKEKKSCEAKLCEMEGQKMTKAILLVATTVVLTFAGLNLYTYAKSSPAQELNAQGVQMAIPVEGMTCFTCETTVQSAVSKLPGIYDVKASAKEKTAWVSYDPKKTSPEHIITAINETGFKAQKPNL